MKRFSLAWATLVALLGAEPAEAEFIGLGGLPGGDLSSVAYGTSADGSVVVGHASSAPGPEAFRWTSGAGMIGLGVLPGTDFNSRAWGVSADGSVVVGDGFFFGTEAFVWEAGNGMRRLADVLTALGDDLTGWTLQSAGGISADGLTIVGWGINPSGDQEAWRATIPEPSSVMMIWSLLAALAVTAAWRRRRHQAA